MAAIAIGSLIQAGINKAWESLAEAMVSAVIRDGKSVTYNPSTDVTTPSWATNVACNVFVYGGLRAEKEDLLTNAKHPRRTQRLLVRKSDFPTRPSTEGQVEISSVIYQITEVQEVPSSSVWHLTIAEA